METSLGSLFLESAIRRFRYYKDLADKTFAQLDEKEFNFQPDKESNNLAIIIQHMHGNMLSRWTNFLTEDGEKAWRQRDEEFEMHDFTRQQLLEGWEKGWTCMFDALTQLSEADLVKLIFIRGESQTVVDAINRQLAHYSYHVGQIVYIGKWIKGSNWINLSMEKRRTPGSQA